MNFRTLTLLLILVNLLYWAWYSWIEQPVIVGMEDHQISDVPLLELATNSNLASSSAVKAGSTATNRSASGQQQLDTATTNLASGDLLPSNSSANGTQSAQAPLVCKRIGAFVNEIDAVEAATWFEGEGIQTQKKIGMDTVWQGYWVYLPKYPNREAAEQVVMALREKGVKDMFIEIVQPNINAVSLGLYRQRSGAESRLRQIQAQGYAARIGNKEREQAVFWLETQIEAAREIPLQRLSAPDGQVSRIEVQDCL